MLFAPADEADLAQFLAATPAEIPVYVIGVGSNLLVRDGGVPGVVIRLGKGFAHVEGAGDHRIRAGAAALDVRVARVALDLGISGLTFLRGIPGTIGGALRMNGGAYGGETKDVLVEARAVDRSGGVHVLSNADMHYSYRHCGAPEDLIFTEALLQGEPGDTAEISAAMDEITQSREVDPADQEPHRRLDLQEPARAMKSWQLIDAAGLARLCHRPGEGVRAPLQFPHQ